MRRVDGLISDIQCPNWDNPLSRNSAANNLDPAKFPPGNRNNRRGLRAG
ncbi:MAG TPA: hypothetical protein VNJ49_21465 [Bradyrhizobium sp.]|nr:hypothetical protein [Bradyrhizobium sp.]